MVYEYEARCKNCNGLLYKYSGENLEVEVICPNCRRINYPNRKDISMGLRGIDFQSKSIDHRCHKCRRLLLRSIGDGYIQIKCHKCKAVTDYNTSYMRSKEYKLPPLEEGNNICY